MLGKIDASLNVKLKSVEWGEYKLGDLFKSSNGDYDIQKVHINNKGDYVITSGISNNGILGRSDIPAKIFNKKTITVDMFGYAFYRNFNYKLVTHARVFSLKPKFEISDNQGIFLASAFHFLHNLFGYENMCSWEKIKDLSIVLPIKNKSIDFGFMESFIAELEAQRFAELEAYLSATGLKNYTLTKEEEQALKDFEKLKFEEHDIIDIFDVKNTSNILSRDIIKNSGMTPYLCASSENNSVSSYITYDERYLEKGNCIFIGGKTFVVSYQKESFFSNDSHNLALYLKSSVATKRKYLYMATCLYKSLCNKYSWGDSISSSKIKSDKIMLPTVDKTVNYSNMETFISAIEKLVIKDLVLYTKKKISKKTLTKNEVD